MNGMCGPLICCTGLMANGSPLKSCYPNSHTRGGMPPLWRIAMIKCAAYLCNKTVHAQNSFCLNHAIETAPMSFLAHELRTNNGPDVQEPTPVQPPHSIWNGIM